MPFWKTSVSYQRLENPCVWTFCNFFLIIIYVAFDQAENRIFNVKHRIWFSILVIALTAEGVLFCYLRSLLATNSLSQWNSCSCALQGLKGSCYFRLAQMVPLLMHRDSSSGLRTGSVAVVLTGDHTQVCGDNSGSGVAVSVSLTWLPRVRVYTAHP